MIPRSQAASPQKHYKLHAMTTSAGCQRIINASVRHLQTFAPFNDTSTQECMELLRFEFQINQKLTAMIKDDQPHNVEEITNMYHQHVDTLTKKLHQQELKNTVRTVGMITAGVLMSLLSVLPLGLPLLFSPVRHYINSLFKIPTPSAQTFESQIRTSIHDLNQLLLGSVTCFGNVNHAEYTLIQKDPDNDLVDAMSGFML